MSGERTADHYLLETVATSCFEPPNLINIQSEVARLAICVAYSLIAILALLGNLLVIAVQKFGRRQNSGIGPYLLNLAVADIFTAVLCVPFSYSNLVLGHWPYPHLLCPVVQFSQLLGVFVTATTLSVIAIQRLAVVYSPAGFISRRMKHHKYGIPVSIWLLGILYSFYLTQDTHTVAFDFDDTTYFECKFDNSLSEQTRLLMSMLNLLLTFLIPLILMTVSYLAILHKLERTNRRNSQILFQGRIKRTPLRVLRFRNGENGVGELGHVRVYQNQSLDSLQRVSMMMYIVILAFCICWLPIKLVQAYITNYPISLCTEWQYYAFFTAFLACHWLAMASSLINPVIYSFVSNNFRDDLMHIYNRIKVKFGHNGEKGKSKHARSTHQVIDKIKPQEDTNGVVTL